MTHYVALYCRISQDKRGRREGVEAQEKWGREYAAATWPDMPIEVFTDNDITAADPGVERPEFNRLREWINDGRIAHIWSVEQYRFVRQEVEWFKVAAELDSAGITELHTNRDGTVRVQDEIAGIKAVLGAGEVRRLKRRLNDRLTEIAASGAPPGGGRRFGYRPAVRDDGARTLEIVPEEAEIIRDTVDRILSGWGLNSIVKDLKDRGVRGPRGGAISPGAIKSWINSPTIAGHRVHQGRIVARGTWEPIVTEDIWQAVKARLAQPRRVKLADGGTIDVNEKYFGTSTGRKYLLTGGLTACGACGAPLYGTTRKYGGTKLPYLLCRPESRGGSGCVGIKMDAVEKHVVDTLFAELDRPEFLDAIGADDHGQLRDKITADLTALDGRRNKLATEWGAGDLMDSEWASARRSMAETEQRLRSELAAIPPPMAGIDINTARQAWPDMLLDEQREFLLLFIERVTVNRGARGRWTPIGERVEIDWRRLR
ncbi:Site-specific DNA recombinase [Amycolatopsis marina]|uniref:Site-specific DNA recombinase n=1 Tax=Amycolatopsis marina TaxID=490629 RepID=A0A1I1ATW6_9PSEU|nr:recombinase family protein [Amycolatopsis marina]SFB39753.1 Site-specific DNA recombinase [Amycolatopsis marina]